jgi:uncharacterized repeat protein (TIGR03803 family)
MTSQRTLRIMPRILSAALTLVIVAALAAATTAQTFTTLLSFDSSDGQNPAAGLILGADGNLYGTTLLASRPPYSTFEGTVFRITPTGTLTTLYTFCTEPGQLCPDGSEPVAALVQATDGNFYGTTTYGGAYCAAQGDAGCGVIFEMSPTGTLTTLYSFCPQTDCSDGFFPASALVQGSDGNFYGTNVESGTGYCLPFYIGGSPAPSCGTVFKITPTGALTTLHSFGPLPDGSEPYGGLVQTADGNFFGTTFAGGTSDNGTIFQITPSDTLTTLYSFCPQSGCTDGSLPYASLIHATDGSFYGTTIFGGKFGNGTVFKITPGGRFTSLYSFCSQSGCADGSQPMAALIQATDGNFYGTTTNGGSTGKGTVFKITPSGTLTTLYSFCQQSGCTDGSLPFAALVQDANNLYGTTYAGGSSGDGGAGTVFSVSLYLGPFTSTALTSSLNPSTYGQKVTWTATVKTSGPVAPTGKVSFYWAGNFLSTAPLNASGVATFTQSLNADLYPLTAVYLGDANNLPSTSAILNQEVKEATSTATLTSSPNPSTQGQSVTFTARISSPTVTATGPVTFTAGKTVLGTGQLSGKATFTTSTLPVGSTTVTATYYGDSNIAESSASVMQTVQQ